MSEPKARELPSARSASASATHSSSMARERLGALTRWTARLVGRLVQRLPELWAAADLSECRRLLLTLLDTVLPGRLGGQVCREHQAEGRVRPLLTDAKVLAAPSTQ